jgi:hypothetical protein
VRVDDAPVLVAELVELLLPLLELASVRATEREVIEPRTELVERLVRARENVKNFAKFSGN